MTERTVYRIVKQDRFHAELDALGYEGPKHLRHSQRGKSQKHDKALSLWLAMQTDGTPKHKQGRRISEEVGAHIQVVRRWIKDWRQAE